MNSFLAPTTPEVTEREREHAASVRKLAGECMVLLKNDGTLPLKETGKLALYGNGARATCKGGTGSGDVYVRETVNIEEGLKREGFQVTTGDWLDRQDAASAAERKEYEAAIRRRAEEEGDPSRATLMMMVDPLLPVALAKITEEDVRKSDTSIAVYVLTRNSGEGKDRVDVPGDYELTEAEAESLRFLAEHYEHFILLLNIGGVIDTKIIRSIPGISAILLLGQLGNVTGLSAADALKGTVLPSGKLTDTWAENYGDYPSSATFGMNDKDVNDEYYTEGIYVGYRYFDTFGVKPAYPFGYGLNYTDFDISLKKVTVDGAKIGVTVDVTNTGKAYPGKEIVQVYVSAPAGKLDKPYQELRGFAKTRELRPGETQTLNITIRAASLASYCPKCASWILEAGDYVIRVGTDSRNTYVAAVITLDQTVATEKLKNLFADPDGAFEELRAPEACPAAVEAPFKLRLAAADIETVTASYAPDAPALPPYTGSGVLRFDEVAEGRASLDAFIAQLSEEELIRLCVGNAASFKNPTEAIGNAARFLPGAAGETTDSLLEKYGLGVMELCDGPAGLRLSPVYLETPEGEAVALFRFGVEIDSSDLKGVKHYQYTTAIPIATSLACSWNLEVLAACGDIVGREMEELGATLWLAPGMNIHRNPLCGRNFEYYSEDPLLTGKCAAADTLGVQKHPGVGTTIKHFLANNQEDNRTFTNSHIHERAVREIYVRGFQIAVRESQPMSLMSSYNLVNGVHAANYTDSLRYLLRDEWGFEGMVMTDWLTTAQLTSGFPAPPDRKYPPSDPAICVKACNDLIEPGLQTDLEGILEGLRNGVITRSDLEACAEHILRLMLRTHLYSGKSYYEEVKTETITFAQEA